MIAYNVYSCDVWKSRDSMRSLGVFTNRTKLKKFLKILVKKKYFETQDKRYIEYLNIERLNNSEYIFIDEIELNVGDV